MRLYTPATMPDINVTYAGLPLNSPFIFAPGGPSMVRSEARSAVEAGAGAIILPPLDEAWMQQRQSDGELTEHNRDNTGGRAAYRVLTRLNTDSYMEQIDALCQELDVPVIASLECRQTRSTLPLAHQMVAAGAAAVEIRPALTDSVRMGRSDQLEKTILRAILPIAERLETPVIARVPAGFLGITALVSVLGESGVRGVVITPNERLISAIDPKRAELVPIEDRRHAAARFSNTMGVARHIYRRVSPHLALPLDENEPLSIVSALLAGATLGVVTGSDGRIGETIRRATAALEEWMGEHSAGSLFDFRGMLSESRLSSSLENTGV